MSEGTAAFLTISSAGVPIAQWHNYRGAPTIDGHAFLDFTHNEIVTSSLSTEAPLEIVLPALASIVEFPLKAFRFGLPIKLELFEFTPLADGGIPPSKTSLDVIEGVALDATETDATITLEVGSEAPTNGAQVPPAPFDSSAVGGLVIL